MVDFFKNYLTDIARILSAKINARAYARARNKKIFCLNVTKQANYQGTSRDAYFFRAIREPNCVFQNYVVRDVISISTGCSQTFLEFSFLIRTATKPKPAKPSIVINSEDGSGIAADAIVS